MEIAFNTQSLRSICEKEDLMDKKLGSAGAKALQVCLADLRAASTVADLTANYSAEVVSRSDIVLVPADGLRLRLRTTDSKVKNLKADGSDWTKVSRLKIMEIIGRV